MYNNKIMKIILSITVAILILLSLMRNSVWKDHYTLWYDAYKKSPDKARVMVNLASSLISKNRFEEAKDILKRAIELYPSEFMVVSAYSAILDRLGMKEESRRYLDFAKALKPDSEEVLIKEGELLTNEGDFTGAIEKYRLILIKNPLHAKALHGMAMVMEKSGKKDEALKYLRMAIEKNMDLSYAWLDYGRILWEQGNFDEAIKVFNESVRRFPQMAEAWNNLGAALASMGKKDEAIRAFENALYLKPESEVIKRNIERLKSTP